MIDSAGLQKIRDPVLIQDGRGQGHIILEQLRNPGGKTGKGALMEQEFGFRDEQQGIAGAEQDDPSPVKMFQSVFQSALNQINRRQRLQILGIPVKRDLAECKGLQFLRGKICDAAQGFQLIMSVCEKFPPGGVTLLMADQFLAGRKVFFVLSCLLFQLFPELLKLCRQLFRADADFQDVIRSAENQSRSYIIKIFIIADDKKFTGDFFFLHLPDQFDSVHDRHLQVTDNQIRLKTARHIQRLLSVRSGCADMKAKRVPVDHGTQGDLYNRFIINDQYLVHEYLLAWFESYCRNPERESVWYSRCPCRGCW